MIRLSIANKYCKIKKYNLVKSLLIMTNSSPQTNEEPTISSNDKAENKIAENIVENIAKNPQPQDSYVKLAMRNMVRKGRQSLWHFFLTTVGLVGVLVGLAYLTKP